MSPAPYLEHSFTRALYEALKRLIKDNPRGFCTSHLYREVYHTMPTTKPGPKPLLFDQARHGLGRIWLRPQVSIDQMPKRTEDRRFLKLTFRLNDSPDLAVMNEIALHLQFIPHVDQIRFEDLYAPKKQITDLIWLVWAASKMRPLVRKLQARRRLQKVRALTEQKAVKPSTSFIKLHTEPSQPPACDWGSALQVKDHSPMDSQESRDCRKRSGTWPPTREVSPINTHGPLSVGQISTLFEVDILKAKNPPYAVSPITNGVHQMVNGIRVENHHKRRRSASIGTKTPLGKLRKTGG